MPALLNLIMDTMKKHIFIVDDDEDEMIFFTEAIKTLPVPHKCTWASNGPQALQQLPYLMPDIIFVDYNMPGMNGLECIQAMKGIPVCRSVPIILHSTKMDSELRIKGLKAGATACIGKQHSLQKLIYFLKSLLPEYMQL